ncbi:hypothetical protein CKO38_00615 [Rhodospirillum rubrum]|uniref:glycosyl hydrolase family 28-related protein n=1 Tax=Rhodospirillum rubrum TaxID=1085 RepID=UPI001906214D|nr:glycosyl hydrolase family 28-related protein [Rhodospirillum rubrum]MBK1663179.1 hypothetical protein [Rhodospirillum rubrum]MBK1675196.1 hypothetical protein [Rhodospirillum rubrum]
MTLGRRALLVAGLVGWLGACAGRPAAGALASPRDFGARGDGLGDDAAAFQAVIDSEAPSLHVPPGRYRIGRPLVPRSNQHWRNDGAQVSVLAQPADDVPPPFNLIERHDRLENVSFSGLGFLGNAARQTTAAVGDIGILGNFLAACGGAGLIDASAAPDLWGLVIGDTTITAPRPGTRALLSGLAHPRQAVITGRRGAGLTAVDHR